MALELIDGHKLILYILYLFIMEQQQSTFRVDSSFDCLLQKINQFSRKAPSHEGARTLAQHAIRYDLSFATTLILTATKYFGQALRKWPKYQPTIQQPLGTFLKHLQFKVSLNPLPSLHQNLAPLKKLFEKVTKRKIPELSDDQKRKYQRQFQKGDYQAREMMTKKQKELQKELEGKNQGLDDILSPDDMRKQQQQCEIPLVLRADPIFNCETSFLEGWRELIFKINLKYSSFFSRWANRTELSSLRLEEWERGRLAENWEANSRDCGCCIDFVNCDQDLAFPSPKQAVAFFGQLSRCDDMKHEITQQIVAFLNGQGGVLFIGCQKESKLSNCPFLEQVSESEKEIIERRLENYIGTIYPPIYLKKQIELSFIPINRGSLDSSPSQFVKGGYLLRIAVTSSEPHHTYFCTLDHSPHFVRQLADHPSALVNQQVYTFISDRFTEMQRKNKHRVPSLKLRGNLEPALVLHSAACRDPKKGIPLYRTQLGKEIGWTGGGFGKSANPWNTNREGFKFITLLVVAKEVVEDIRKLLVEREKFQIIIEAAFPSRKYTLSNNTWLIWHNVKFQKLKSGISKESHKLRPKNSKSPPILISTLNIISVAFKLDQAQVQELQQLALQSANQKVEHKVVEGIDYFVCPSTITAILLYFHLTNRTPKTAKFSKIPSSSNPTRKQVKEKEREIPVETHRTEEKPQKQNPAELLIQTFDQASGVSYCYYNNGYVYAFDMNNTFLWMMAYTHEEYQRAFLYSQY